MNCETIKQNVGIRTVLESFGHFPVKENHKTGFYFALDREEKIPSLSVDFIKNKAFDFGTGKSYDVISIVQQMNQCSVSEALKYLSTFEFSSQNEFPNEVRGKFNNWMFGCEICQDVCPLKKFAKPHQEKLFEPSTALLSMNKKEWEEITAETFQVLFKNSAVKRTKFEGLKRNINWL